MGNRRYPVLTAKEVENILLARGFILHHTRGDHKYYVMEVRGKKCIAQVDTGSTGYESSLIKLLLSQTQLTREQFYCSTKSTAKKINRKCACSEELEKWALAKSIS